MRSINELISIVKRILLDVEIKPIDLSRLKDWTDRNRNLAYDSVQSELIVLLDYVIDKRCLNQNSKELILYKASFLAKGHNSCVDALYDLYEMIDQYGNKDSDQSYEKEFLLNWRDNKRELFHFYWSDEHVDSIVEKMISNSELLEEERNYAFDKINYWIQFELLETKINHLCNLVKQRKNIGPDLIEVLDNDGAIARIHEMGADDLDCFIRSGDWACENIEVIVVSLTLIAMLRYDSGNYYSSVRTTYSELYKEFSDQRIEGGIRSLLSRYKRPDENGTRTRIINVVLENAIVPQAYLAAYFEFIFDIYKLNFDYDLPDNPYEEFKFVFEGLRNIMQSEGDNISINVTQKTYKLIASTKSLISDENGMDALIKLSIIVVKLIDRRFWDKEIKLFNPYLRIGFEGWEKQFNGMNKENRREQRFSSNDFRSRWEPKFSYTMSGVCLVPPAHRVKAQYDYKSIAIEVLNETDLLVRYDNCYIKEIIGGYEVSSPNIIISRPLGKLSYRVVAGEEVLYDSKDKLYRNYIVFNGNREEISNNTDYQGTAYICYKSGEADVECIEVREHYCWGFKLIRGGEALAIGHDVFNFSSMIKPGVFGRAYEKCQIMDLDGKETLKVYREISALVFEADGIYKKFDLIINGKSHKLTELPHKTTERGSITKYVVDLDLSQSGIYDIEVNLLSEGKSKHIFSDRIAYDKNLVFAVNSLDEGKSAISVLSDILSVPFSAEVSAKDFDPNFIKFFCDGVEYAYYLPLNLRYYTLDGIQWHDAAEDIWIEDVSLNTTMRLYDAECNGITVRNENDILVDEGVAISDCCMYKTVDIGFLNSYKVVNKFIKLVFWVDEKKMYAITCYNKCVLDEKKTQIEFLDNPPRILVTPRFHGKNKVSFEMYDSKGVMVAHSKLLENGQTEQINNFLSFEEYTFNFHEKTKALRLRKDTLLFSTKKTFYAKRDFVGRALKIDTIYYNTYVNKKELQEIERHLYIAFVRIADIRDDGILVGSIFVKTYKGEWCLDKINPVEVEICSEIIDDTMDVYITNYGDGLLYDEKKHGILNSIEDAWAPDIFLYTLDLKGDYGR